MSEECERGRVSERVVRGLGRRIIKGAVMNAIRCHAAMRHAHALALFPTPPSLPASISVSSPAIAADADPPLGCLSALIEVVTLYIDDLLLLLMLTCPSP